MSRKEIGFDPHNPESGFVRSYHAKKFRLPLEPSVPPYIPPVDGPSFENTQALIETIFRRGDHLFLAQHGKQVVPPEIRGRLIHTYATTEDSLEDLGKSVGISKEGVRNLIRTAVWTIYEQTEELNRSFSWEGLVFAKPITQKTRRKIASGNNHTASEIVDMAGNGATYDQLLGNGYSSSQIFSARKSSIAAEKGVTVPAKTPTRTREFQERLNILQDGTSQNQERQLVINILTQGVIDRSKSDSVVRLSEILREAGISLRGRRAMLPRVVAMLQNADIPAGLSVRTRGNRQSRYGFVPQCDVQAAVDFLKKDERLAKYRQNTTPQSKNTEVRGEFDISQMGQASGSE